MEKKDILEGIKSLYMFDIIFSYIENNNYKYKLFNYSKAFQKKINITLFDYQKRYLDQKGIKKYSYFSNKYYCPFEKDTLDKKFKEDSLTFNITKDVFQKYLDDFFENYHKKNIFLIDIYSPFFEILSTKKYFKDFFSIQVILDSFLENDYVISFDKLNKLKSEYSSLDFVISNNMEIEKWKEYNINFSQIKNLNILESYKYTDSKDKIIKFTENIVNFENFQNNLKVLEIYFNEYYSFNSSSFDNFNNFTNLETLKLSGFHFTSTLRLNLYNLKELELTNCEKIVLAEYSCLNLKKLSLKGDCSIEETGNLMKFPELEICILNNNHSLNLFIDFDYIKKLKIIEIKDKDFLLIENIPNVCLQSIKIFSDFKDEIIAKNLVEKLINRKKTIKNIYIFINKDNSDEFIKLLPDLFIEYQKKEKIEDLLDILLNIILINDEYAFDRYIKILGYASLVILPIPLNNINQKWPLFGERLINGNINEEIYEYLTTNHRERNICLLEILFPSKHNKENNYNVGLKYNRVNKIIISDELKKNILIKIINNCFEEKNYQLFKYIYLMPSRSLLFKNLYEEIKLFLNKEKSIDFEGIREKENQYIKNIEQEINKSINKAKNKDKIKDEENVYLDDKCKDNWFINKKYNTWKKYFGRRKGEFNYNDKELKNFLGFNSNIIPGQIIREEIIVLAQTQYFCLYRLAYYTKYYNIEELRNNLLKIIY